MKGLALAGTLLLTACGGLRTKAMDIRVLQNDRDRVLPCMYVVEDEWPQTMEEAQEQVLNEPVNKVVLTFKGKANDLSLKMVPVAVDSEGKLQRQPQRGDELSSEFTCESNPRSVRWTDPNQLLFVFWEKPLN